MHVALINFHVTHHYSLPHIYSDAFESLVLLFAFFIIVVYNIEKSILTFFLGNGSQL